MKIDLNKTNLMIEDLKKTRQSFKFYSPKINIQTFRNNRLVNDIPLLKLHFCFH